MCYTGFSKWTGEGENRLPLRMTEKTTMAKQIVWGLTTLCCNISVFKHADVHIPVTNPRGSSICLSRINKCTQHLKTLHRSSSHRKRHCRSHAKHHNQHSEQRFNPTGQRIPANPAVIEYCLQTTSHAHHDTIPNYTFTKMRSGDAHQPSWKQIVCKRNSKWIIRCKTKKRREKNLCQVKLSCRWSHMTTWFHNVQSVRGKSWRIMLLWVQTN